MLPTIGKPSSLCFLICQEYDRYVHRSEKKTKATITCLKRTKTKKTAGFPFVHIYMRFKHEVKKNRSKLAKLSGAYATCRCSASLLVPCIGRSLWSYQVSLHGWNFAVQPISIVSFCFQHCLHQLSPCSGTIVGAVIRILGQNCAQKLVILSFRPISRRDGVEPKNCLDLLVHYISCAAVSDCNFQVLICCGWQDTSTRTSFVSAFWVVVWKYSKVWLGRSWNVKTPHRAGGVSLSSGGSIVWCTKLRYFYQHIPGTAAVEYR